MDTPDVTKAQIIAIIQPPVTLAIAFGAPITTAQETALMGMAGAISTALIVMDGLMRRARANNAVAIAQSQVVQAQIEPEPLKPYVLGQED